MPGALHCSGEGSILDAATAPAPDVLFRLGQVAVKLANNTQKLLLVEHATIAEEHGSAVFRRLWMDHPSRCMKFINARTSGQSSAGGYGIYSGFFSAWVSLVERTKHRKTCSLMRGPDADAPPNGPDRFRFLSYRCSA
jgi:hypothetical protein